MVSVTGITDQYILQPGLIRQHQTTLEWLSATLLWRAEIDAFQKMLDLNASKFCTVEDKKRMNHFQSLFIYYNGELIDSLRTTLRLHEQHLAGMLQSRNELDTQYFKEHEAIMDKLESFASSFVEMRREFLDFIQS